MYTLDELKTYFSEALAKENLKRKPKELYDPIDYIMALGGKRLRPVLLLHACDLFGGEYYDALYPSIAIEIFHNFTLVHDDIMDNAPVRRGKPTVYKKWNSNIAILSGDTMFALALQYLIRTREDIIPEIVDVFTKTAIEVCEGQQYDMNFETKDNVSIDDYLQMIRLKTGVLIASSLKVGATIAKADPLDIKNMYNFGINLGIAFQLMDDLLDVFANEEKFGKKTGGDILTNKKTYLYLKAYEVANEKQKQILDDCFKHNKCKGQEKIDTVKDIYNQLNIKYLTQKQMDLYYQHALSRLDAINQTSEDKLQLKSLADKLMRREF